MSSPPSIGPEPLSDRVMWLVRLRWVAVTGVLMVVLLANLAGALPSPTPLVVVAAALGVANGAFAVRARRRRGPIAYESLEREVFGQLSVDVVALALLLHWSDGVENPFAMFFAFLLAIGGRLLSPRRAWGLAIGTLLLQCGIIVAEHLGLLAHHGLLLGDAPHARDEAIESPQFLVGYVTAFCLTNIGIVHFMVDTSARAHAAEERRQAVEQAAFARERLATLGEISAGVAHSLGNPVHGLLNCVEILRGQVAGQPAVQPTLELMDEALGRIGALARRLLAYAREVPLQRRVMDLREVVDEAVRMAVVSARPRALPLRREAGAQVAAPVDPGRMGEALANVLDNAAYAVRDHGAVSVAVVLEAEHAVIEVRDSGPGIRPEILGRVTEAFFTTKPIGEGTGLGLAIARRIVEEHGGRLVVTSQPGAGTCVRLLLPRVPLEQDVHGVAPCAP